MRQGNSHSLFLPILAKVPQGVWWALFVFALHIAISQGKETIIRTLAEHTGIMAVVELAGKNHRKLQKMLNRVCELTKRWRNLSTRLEFLW